MEVSTGCPKYGGVLLVVSNIEVSTGCPKYRGFYWLTQIWRFLQGVPSMVVLLVDSRMRGFTGFFEYTGLYKVS